MSFQRLMESSLPPEEHERYRETERDSHQPQLTPEQSSGEACEGQDQHGCRCQYPLLPGFLRGSTA